MSVLHRDYNDLDRGHQGSSPTYKFIINGATVTVSYTAVRYVHVYAGPLFWGMALSFCINARIPFCCGWVISSIIKCGMKLLIRFQT